MGETAAISTSAAMEGSVPRPVVGSLGGLGRTDVGPARPADSPTAATATRKPPRTSVRSTNIGDRIFHALTTGFAASIVGILLIMFGVLVWQGRFSIQAHGLSFITGLTWDPSLLHLYGAAPSILGTLYTSALALLLAAPVGLMLAVFLSEIAPRRMRFPFGFLVELLAAVPSIVYGLWGLFVLVPFVRDYIEPIFQSHFGSVALFQGPPIGIGILSAVLILAIMILPTVAAISRDVMQAVPDSQRDAMLALGATRWETTWKVVVPAARSGIIGAIILGLGRAVGETMAVQMVIGNSVSQFNVSLFGFGTTLPATIVNQFQEATGAMYRSALIELALILMLVTVTLNIIARALVWRVSR